MAEFGIDDTYLLVEGQVVYEIHLTTFAAG